MVLICKWQWWCSYINASYLFYVQKVFGFKVDGSTLDWTIFIKGSTVTHISFHCKCYWFRLLKDNESKEGTKDKD